MPVRLLEDHVINQIAAGEVVERPASVVKELLENALDAGARTVRVSLRSGGRSLIRITDDGSGMDRADALMCLERHATSKIRRTEDLEAVGTLGFRGEAVPSIASVAKFQLVTRPSEQEIGTRIRVEAGKILDVRDAGCAAGTEIDVRSLFFNLPARRKFLRTVQTELSHCLEAVTREALVRPDVDFAVHHDDREVLRAPVAADRAARARDLLGTAAQALLEVRFEEAGYEVIGGISPVGVHRSTPSGAMYLYVNGRYVRDPVLRRAVNEAYRELVPKGRYPVAVLDVRMEPGAVDVNVHPSKVEVRFRDPRLLGRVVAQGLRETLERHGIQRPLEDRSASDDPRAPSLPLPGMRPAPRKAPPLAAEPHPLFAADPRASGRTLQRPAALPEDDPTFQAVRPSADPLQDLLVERPAPGPVAAGVEGAAPVAAPVEPLPGPPSEEPRPPVTEPPQPTPPPDAHLLPVARYRDLRLIGQLAGTYLLCEGAGQLVVIDQHAAHERILLHRLLSDRQEVLGGSQRLLAPALVQLPRARVAGLSDRLDVLESLGIEVEVFGPGEVAVKAIPPLLKGVDLGRLVADLADELVQPAGPRSGEDLIRQLLGTLACHHAVRARQTLSDYEMRALLASLDEVDFEVCAHGRPVAVRIDASELERRFHRR